MSAFATLRGAARRLRRERRGLALVEFAMVLPFMLLLYLGGFEVGDGIACSRKVTITTRALADLVSQSVSGSTSASEVDSDLAASAQVLMPYATSNAVGRVSEIYTDGNYNTTVVWSRGLNATGYAKGSAVTNIPASLKIPGIYLLSSEISYAYAPPVTFGLVQPLTLASNLYMLPRNTSSVDCGDC